MPEKIVINPALIAALDHYAGGLYDFKEPTLFQYRDEKGGISCWPLERACGVAAEVLNNEDLAFLKLKRLKQGMKEFGMQALYERIMGEDLGGK
jgi:hypothetical protein